MFANFSLAILGMAIIVLSWPVQIFFTLKSGKGMRPCFAILQFVGIALLVADTFQAGGMNPLAWLNVGSAAGALAMFVLLLRK